MNDSPYIVTVSDLPVTNCREKIVLSTKVPKVRLRARRPIPGTPGLNRFITPSVNEDSPKMPHNQSRIIVTSRLRLDSQEPTINEGFAPPGP
jgi:hypothetical protein